MKKTITPEGLKDVLQRISFKSNRGNGARVLYPNELMHELFGKEILKTHWIYEDIPT